MIFVDNCTGNNAYIGDLYCDDENNNIFCQFDGGDCCNSQMTQLNFCEECACFKGKYCIVTHTACVGFQFSVPGLQEIHGDLKQQILA